MDNSRELVPADNVGEVIRSGKIGESNASDSIGEGIEPNGLAQIIQSDNAGELNASDSVGEDIEPNGLNQAIRSDNVDELKSFDSMDEALRPSDLINAIQSIDNGEGDQSARVDGSIRPNDPREETELDDGLSYHGVLIEHTHRHNNIDSKTFHDWANNKHGPERVKLEYIESGRRYRAMDGDEPKYMTIYEVKALGHLHKESFTKLGKCHTATGQDLSDEYVDMHTKVYDTACARGLQNPEFGEKLIVSRWIPRKAEDLVEILQMYEVGSCNNV